MHPVTPADALAAVAFPDPRAVVADDARRFRRLSARARWHELFALHAWGLRQAAVSPRRDEIARLWEDEERRWRLIQTQLFAHHGG
jgi:hypothetical protein